MKYLKIFSVASLCVSACSPYPYSEAAGKFADGVTAVSAAVQTNTQAARVARLDSVRFERRNRRPPISISARCRPLSASGGDCVLVEADAAVRRQQATVEGQHLLDTAVVGQSPAAGRVLRTNPGAVRPDEACPNWPGDRGTPPEPRELTVDEVLKALTDYAKGLRAITNAKDRQEFDAARADLAKAATTLGTTIGLAMGPGGALIGTAAGSVVNLGAYLVGTALDHRRYEVLRETVLAACLPIRTLALAAGGLLEAGVRQRVAYLNQSGLTLTRDLGPTTRQDIYDARYREAEAVSESLQSIRGTDALELGLKMRQAHDALVSAIVDGDGETLAMLVTVGNFADAANATRNAFQAR